MVCGTRARISSEDCVQRGVDGPKGVVILLMLSSRCEEVGEMGAAGAGGLREREREKERGKERERERERKKEKK
jgi:hypothetical protein